jgi:predicted permease
MDTLWQDLRFGVRMLVKNPGFTAVAVLTLALGIGANATIFSIVNAVLLQPLPYRDADRLVMVWETSTQSPDDIGIVSAPNYLDWQRQNDVFESMAFFDSAGRGYNLSGGPEPEQVSGVRVSASFFSVFGVTPALGRIFLPDEETPGKDHVVVLSDSLWRRRYGADPNLIDKTIRVDGEDYTVVGIMPPGFHFQFWSSPRQLWVPVVFTEGDLERGSHSFVVCARLKAGVSIEQSRAQMDVIGRSLSEQYPKDNAGKTATVSSMEDFGKEDSSRTLLALFAVVGFVLLIACANVANLMLARGASRQREFAIRCALGARRWRIARQLITESLLLAAIGGICGLFVASWTSSLLVGILPGDLRYIPFRPLTGVAIDGRVMAFTWLLSCLTGILFGLAPALSVSNTDVSGALKESNRGNTRGAGSRLRYMLVAAEVALALVVLAGAGLMVESLVRLLSVEPGLDPKNVLTLEMSLPQENLYYGPPVNKRFTQDLQTHVGSLPGVLAVSGIGHLPLSGANAGRGFTIEGRPDPGPENQAGAGYSVACPNYFQTMGIPLVAGREFSEQDRFGAPGVIVINETMARKYWPDEDPIGKRIKLGYFDSKEPWLTVVGVAKDVRHSGLDRRINQWFVRPYDQAAWPFMTIVVRTAGAPMSMAESIKKALAKVEPDRPVSSTETMEDVVRNSVGPRRFPMILLIAFALLALTLAAVGISGVVSYSVTQRTQEIGIRLALGAQKRDVLKLILGRSMISVLAGVVIGLAAAAGLMRFLAGLLYEVKPLDPWVLSIVAALLTGVALAASYVPALRATKVDPIVALRYE